MSASTPTTTGSTPITADGIKPRKQFYRQRAHCNVLAHNNSFQYPHSTSDVSWLQEHYPNLPQDARRPTILDVGCGFGGLTVALATIFPEEIIMGLEIRAKVTEYVRLRIVALRQESAGKGSKGKYDNCSVMRTNSMKFMPNFFPKASIKKLFFCFPDPNFKRKNHGRRIISARLLSEYAYLLQPRIGRLYCITDVKELHEWHEEKCNAHPMFRQITDEKILRDDPCVEAMKNETEEGKKVSRSGGDNKKGEKYYCVYERIPDDEIVPVHADSFFFSSSNTTTTTTSTTTIHQTNKNDDDGDGDTK